MKDPTMSVRKMYMGISELDGMCPVYDGWAPSDRPSKFALISSTKFDRFPAKMVDIINFTVTLDIFEEFLEDGNNEGVDLLSGKFLDVLMPLKSSGYLLLDGFEQSGTILQSGLNDVGQTGKSVIVFRKQIVLTHVLSET